MIAKQFVIIYYFVSFLFFGVSLVTLNFPLIVMFLPTEDIRGLQKIYPAVE